MLNVIWGFFLDRRYFDGSVSGTDLSGENAVIGTAAGMPWNLLLPWLGWWQSGQAF